MANKKDKSRIVTRIIAAFLAGLMILGTVAGVLYSIFAR